jgi:hypothetical protein
MAYCDHMSGYWFFYFDHRPGESFLSDLFYKIDRDCLHELHWNKADHVKRLALLDADYANMMRKYFGPGEWDNIFHELVVCYP